MDAKQAIKDKIDYFEIRLKHMPDRTEQERADRRVAMAIITVMKDLLGSI